MGSRVDVGVFRKVGLYEPEMDGELEAADDEGLGDGVGLLVWETSCVLVSWRVVESDA